MDWKHLLILNINEAGCISQAYLSLNPLDTDRVVLAHKNSTNKNISLLADEPTPGSVFRQEMSRR